MLHRVLEQVTKNLLQPGSVAQNNSDIWIDENCRCLTLEVASLDRSVDHLSKIDLLTPHGQSFYRAPGGYEEILYRRGKVARAIEYQSEELVTCLIGELIPPGTQL